MHSNKGHLFSTLSLSPLCVTGVRLYYYKLGGGGAAREPVPDDKKPLSSLLLLIPFSFSLLIKHFVSALCLYLISA
jgi:hypothetical protein